MRPDRRFPKSRRLLNRKDFENVFREGRKAVRPSIVLYARAVPEGQEPRLGLAVSRKVGKAVVRNRVRRRLREVFRLLVPRLLEAPVEVVLVARPKAAESSYAALEREVHGALRKLGFLDESGHQA